MTESERLGRLAHEAWMDHAAQDRPAKVRRVPWERCHDWERRDYQVIAMAVADAVSEPLLAEIRRLNAREPGAMRVDSSLVDRLIECSEWLVEDGYSRDCEPIRAIREAIVVLRGMASRPTSAGQREMLGRIAYEASRTNLNYESHWDRAFFAPEDREHYSCIADAVAAAIESRRAEEIDQLVSQVTELTRERDAALTAMDEACGREAELIRKIHHLEDLHKG